MRSRLPQHCPRLVSLIVAVSVIAAAEAIGTMGVPATAEAVGTIGNVAAPGTFPAPARNAAGTSDPPPGAAAGGTIETRIAPPPGFTRLPCPRDSFGAWLRALPLKPDRPPVRLHDGTVKRNQEAHHAVVDMEIGSRDLQQCADAVIRLRAEYLFGRSCGDAIQFHFTSGDLASWRIWRQGMRPSVRGNRVSWGRTGQADSTYESFRRYLDVVFTYAGSASLARELVPVADPSRPQVGDVFIQGGSPGHAVIVVNVAEGPAGDRVFLLAQSYMPAQEIHLLRSFHEASPWYPAAARGALRTPEWTFDYGDLHRFPPAPCERSR